MIADLATAERLGYDSAWMPGSRPVQHMEEYLRILVPLLRDQRVDFDGTALRARYRSEAAQSDVALPASLPFLLSDDAEASRVRAAEEFAVDGRLPAYQAVLRRQGMQSPAEVAVVGDEAMLANAVRRVGDTGVTDLQITPFGDERERRRTLEFMATLR